jgi:VWFA-related protein
MSTRSGSYLITGFILLSFFALFPGPGSEEAALWGPESSPQEGLQHDVTVTLKLVQIYVTDAEGRPVTDLSREDFVLFDNGMRQEITDFEKHLLLPPEKADHPAGHEDESSMPKPVGLNRKFFILLDIVGNDDVGIIKAKRTALHFLDTQLLPEDEAAVLSFTPTTGLNLLTYLTKDRARLHKTIDSAQEVPPGKTPVGMTWESEMARGETAAGLRGDSEATEALGRETAFLEPSLALKVRSAAFLPLEVSELAKALRYIPGYKHIVFFSGGGLAQLQPLYERMGRELAASNCLVYAVNTLGQRANLRGHQFIADNNLRALASVSGGRYFDDVDEYQAIATDIQETTGNYYVLGYYIDTAWDGQYHAVKVELQREGCEVHAQAGYFNPKPYQQFSDLEKQLHLLDLALSPNPYHQEPLRFPLLPLICYRSGRSHVILMSRLPVEPLKDRITGNAELVTLVYDDKHSLVFSSRGEMMFSAIPEDMLFQYTVAELPPGDYTSRMVIRDLDSGESAVGASAIHVPEPEGQGMHMDPPLVLAPGNRARFLRLSQDRSERGSARSLSEFYPFLSNHWLPLMGDLSRETRTLLAIVRSVNTAVPEPETWLSVLLKHESSGQESPLSFAVLDSEQQGPTDILLLELSLPGLEDGRYSLIFTAEEGSTRAISTASRAFFVR